MATIQTSKNINIFVCDNCHFTCSKKGDYNRHLLTLKHVLATNSNTHYIKNINMLHICDTCNKEYNDRTGLWRHKKKCNTQINTIPTTSSTQVGKNEFHVDKELLIKMLLKNQDVMENVISKNQEVMEKMMEMMPQMGNNSHNTNSHNTTNNQFNIQMFLNEHCKNAMNLADFIETLPITAATYDSTIENGLTKTITNMITSGLSKLDILERPIHCTDATRKTLYVKESNIWEKDTELLKVVTGITKLIRKKRTLISRWKEVNEGWDTIERKQIKFTELVCNIMTDIEYDEKETGKIVRSISKTVYLDNEEKKKYLC